MSFFIKLVVVVGLIFVVWAINDDSKIECRKKIAEHNQTVRSEYSRDPNTCPGRLW